MAQFKIKSIATNYHDKGVMNMKTDFDEIKKLLDQSKQDRFNKALCVGIIITLIAAIAGAVWYIFFKDKCNCQDDWDDEDWDDDDFDDYDFDEDTEQDDQDQEESEDKQ